MDETTKREIEEVVAEAVAKAISESSKSDPEEMIGMAIAQGFLTVAEGLKPALEEGVPILIESWKVSLETEKIQRDVAKAKSQKTISKMEAETFLDISAMKVKMRRNEVEELKLMKEIKELRKELGIPDEGEEKESEAKAG